MGASIFRLRQISNDSPSARCSPLKTLGQPLIMRKIITEVFKSRITANTQLVDPS